MDCIFLGGIMMYAKLVGFICLFFALLGCGSDKIVTPDSEDGVDSLLAMNAVEAAMRQFPGTYGRTDRGGGESEGTRVEITKMRRYVFHEPDSISVKKYEYMYDYVYEVNGEITSQVNYKEEGGWELQRVIYPENQPLLLKLMRMKSQQTSGHETIHRGEAKYPHYVPVRVAPDLIIIGETIFYRLNGEINEDS